MTAGGELPTGATGGAGKAREDDLRHPVRRLRQAFVGIEDEPPREWTLPGPMTKDLFEGDQPAVRPRRGEIVNAAPRARPAPENTSPVSDSPRCRPRGRWRARLLLSARRWPLLTAVALMVVAGGAATTIGISTRVSPATVERSPLAPRLGLAAAPGLASPSARDGAAMAYDPADQDVILFGGLVSGGYWGQSVLPDTWRWDGSRWTELHPPASPPALTQAVMAYDPSSQRLVLTGGETATADGDFVAANGTWTWNGSTWSPQPTGNLPPSAGPFGLATDDATGQLILVAASDGCHGVNTWRWSGSAWVLLHSTTPPAAAYPVGLAYDPGASTLTLLASAGTCPEDMVEGAVSPTATFWSWGGLTWTSEGSSVPATLAGSGELATSATGLLLVTPNVIYRWSGSEWPTTAASPGVADAALAYDAADRQLVLFGGICTSCGGDSPLDGTWTWDGTWTLRDGSAPTANPDAPA